MRRGRHRRSVVRRDAVQEDPPGRPDHREVHREGRVDRLSCVQPRHVLSEARQGGRSIQDAPARVRR